MSTGVGKTFVRHFACFRLSAGLAKPEFGMVCRYRLTTQCMSKKSVVESSSTSESMAKHQADVACNFVYVYVTKWKTTPSPGIPGI